MQCCVPDIVAMRASLYDRFGWTWEVKDAPRNSYRACRRYRLFEPGARAASAIATSAAVADRHERHARRSGSVLSGRAPLLRGRHPGQHAHSVMSSDQPAKDQPCLPRCLAEIRTVTIGAPGPRRSSGFFLMNSVEWTKGNCACFNASADAGEIPYPAGLANRRPGPSRE
jgi:hypothetical protein